MVLYHAYIDPDPIYAGVSGCRTTQLDLSRAQALLATRSLDSKQGEAAVLQPRVSVWAEVLVYNQQHHGSCTDSAAGLEAWQSLVAFLRCHHHTHCLLRTGKAVTIIPINFLTKDDAGMSYVPVSARKSQAGIATTHCLVRNLPFHVTAMVICNFVLVTYIC